MANITVSISQTLPAPQPISGQVTQLIDSVTGLTPAGVTLPLNLSFASGSWTTSFVGLSTSSFTFFSTFYNADASTFIVPGSIPNPVGAVTGIIINQASLTQFLGGLNLAILTNQNNASTAINNQACQIAITAAEARIMSRLGQLRCSGGTFFKMPLSVGGIAPINAPSSISYSVLQLSAHEYAGFILNKWRDVMASLNTDDQGPTAFRMARGWEKDADEEVKKIIRWAQGFTDGSYVDLDLNTGAVVGQIFQVVSTPQIAGACVGPDGMPFVRIANPWMYWAGWPAWPGLAGNGAYPFAGYAISE
jgi:hypothetical protein